MTNSPSGFEIKHPSLPHSSQSCRAQATDVSGGDHRRSALPRSRLPRCTRREVLQVKDAESGELRTDLARASLLRSHFRESMADRRRVACLRTGIRRPENYHILLSSPTAALPSGTEVGSSCVIRRAAEEWQRERDDFQEKQSTSGTIFFRRRTPVFFGDSRWNL